MSLHHSLSSPAPRRTSPLLVAGIAVGSFVIGGLATIGLISIPQLLRGTETAAVVAPSTIPMAPEATRAATPGLLDVTTPTVNAVATPEVVAAAPAATASIPSATSVLGSVTPEVSQKSKEEAIAEAIAIANRNKMRMLTEGVVAGLYSVSVETDGAQGNRIGLNSINAASAAEDSQTLLFDIVQRALEKGNADEIAAAQEMRRRAFASSGAETEVVSGKRYYVVESGDSLAYISLQFFGNTGAYTHIFEANRDVLQTPNQIQIGQRLVIPNI